MKPAVPIGKPADTTVERTWWYDDEGRQLVMWAGKMGTQWMVQIVRNSVEYPNAFEKYQNFYFGREAEARKCFNAKVGEFARQIASTMLLGDQLSKVKQGPTT